MNDRYNQPYRLSDYIHIEPYSFVHASAVDKKIVGGLKLSPGERLYGMYINDPDHIIVFTNMGFYWIRKDREVICPYADIEQIKLPEDEQDVDDERAIEIELKNGDFLFLPVFGDTEGALDIYMVAQLLGGAIETSRNLAAMHGLIRQLKAAVEDFKQNPTGWKVALPVDYVEAVIKHVESCISECLDARPTSPDRRGDQAALVQPHTWRLIAEVLLAPKGSGLGAETSEDGDGATQ